MLNQQFKVIIVLFIYLHVMNGYSIHNGEFQNGRLSNLCRHCKGIVTHILQNISNLDFQLKWETKLVNGCKYTGPFRDYCASLFSTTMFKIINKYIVNLKPEEFCQVIYVCPA
ncbi:hypothetical protein MN116_007353 [Schistosoma mekongi]|uniref:Saposin B-type domain-containing protein n=1 Tax=Schistosoma mekongi TaxID=38744 RepID=A0AAE2D3I2_SCHME|nr:hypothetical protein MN116_007353 [Schistosoma mekongi]